MNLSGAGGGGNGGVSGWMRTGGECSPEIVGGGPTPALEKVSLQLEAVGSLHSHPIYSLLPNVHVHFTT